ncbi:MAG TPA: hypothetical protein VK507_12690 [Iamia sp.]|nr:hypothetical protein [Iamia sp.]
MSDDDDLTRDLEAWAAATDPAADPITEIEVAGADASPVAARRPVRRWLAGAAALLVVLALAVTVVTARDDGTDVVADVDRPTLEPADPTPDGTIPVQVVAVSDPGPDVVLTWSAQPCPARASCIGLPGPDAGATTLILDGAMDEGTVLQPHVTARRCDGLACAVEDTSGAIVASCATEPLALDGPTQAVLTIAAAGGTITCSLEEVDDLPALSVPPAFSTRTRSPMTGCGTGAYHAGGGGPARPAAATASFRCLADAVGSDELTELMTSEAHPDGAVSFSWWRALPEPVDGLPVEVFRQGGHTMPGWTRLRCADVEVDGDGGAELVGCTDEESLSYEPLPLPAGATADEEGDDTGVAIVLDLADLPRYPEGPQLFRWDLITNGNRVQSGQMDEAGVLLVADGLDLGRGARVTWSPYVCPMQCPVAGAGGRPFVGIEPVEGFTASPPTCEEELPRLTDGDVVVLRVRGEACTVEVADEVPVLTAPPAWTLRPPTDVRCAIPDGGTAEEAGSCLGEARGAGLTAEWWTYDEEGEPLVWRIGGMRVVDLVRPRTDGGPWTVQHCLGFGLMDLVPGPESDGCAAEEEMRLSPPP